ncbi:MAG: hypothetical protein Q9227_005057 [Pyrenula ochraceoflavens]
MRTWKTKLEDDPPPKKPHGAGGLPSLDQQGVPKEEQPYRSSGTQLLADMDPVGRKNPKHHVPSRMEEGQPDERYKDLRSHLQDLSLHSDGLKVEKDRFERFGGTIDKMRFLDKMDREADFLRKSANFLDRPEQVDAIEAAQVTAANNDLRSDEVNPWPLTSEQKQQHGEAVKQRKRHIGMFKEYVDSLYEVADSLIRDGPSPKKFGDPNVINARTKEAMEGTIGETDTDTEHVAGSGQ